MVQPLNITDSVRIEAAPDKVWDLVADVTLMGAWSPETTKARWLAPTGARAPAVGARFRGANKRGIVRWSTTCEVIAADRGRTFSFVRPGLDGGCEWRFVMEDDGGATVLTEHMVQRKGPPAFMQVVGRLLFGSQREQQLRDGIRTTIERVKAAAESAPA